MKPIKNSTVKEEVNDSGNAGITTPNLENQPTTTLSGKSDIMNEQETMKPQKESVKVEENTTTRMELALSIVMHRFNLEGKDYVLTAFDDKGEGKKCKLTLTNGEFTVAVTIHEW